MLAPVALALWSLVAQGAPGELDPTFQPPSEIGDPSLLFSVQSDGKIVTERPRNQLIRLNEDGSQDGSFATIELPLASLYGLVYSSEGKWYVNGISTIDRSTPTIIRLRHNGEIMLPCKLVPTRSMA